MYLHCRGMSNILFGQPCIRQIYLAHLIKNISTFDKIEPGYYEAGSFGIRIEDVIQVVDLPNSSHYFGNKGALCFEDITMVPIQKKMINVTMLTDKEVRIVYVRCH